MPLLMGKCNNCGGTIELQQGTRSGVCPFCSTPYIAEDIINHYNYYTNNNYHINNAELKIEDGSSIEQRFASAEVYLTKFKDYERAEKIYLELTDLVPHDYRCWWGLVRTATNDLSDYYIGDSKLRTIQDSWVSNALAVANPEEKRDIENRWGKYLSCYSQNKSDYLNERNSSERKRNELSSRLQQLQAKNEKLSNEIISAEEKDAALDASIKKGKSSIGAKIFVGLAIIVLTFILIFIIPNGDIWVLDVLLIILGISIIASSILYLRKDKNKSRELKEQLKKMREEAVLLKEDIDNTNTSIQHFEQRITDLDIKNKAE